MHAACAVRKLHLGTNGIEESWSSYWKGLIFNYFCRATLSHALYSPLWLVWVFQTSYEEIQVKPGQATLLPFAIFKHKRLNNMLFCIYQAANTWDWLNTTLKNVIVLRTERWSHIYPRFKRSTQTGRMYYSYYFFIAVKYNHCKVKNVRYLFFSNFMTMHF